MYISYLKYIKKQTTTRKKTTTQPSFDWEHKATCGFLVENKVS